MAFAEKKKRKREDYFYHLDYRTRWLDNDMYHHMNNNVYGMLFDSIINDYLMKFCGRHPPTSTENGIIVNSYCDFFGSVAYPSVVELGMRVNKLGKTSVTYEVGVFEQGVDDVKAVGGFTHVFIDKATGRPRTEGMSDHIREPLERIHVDLAKKRSTKL